MTTSASAPPPNRNALNNNSGHWRDSICYKDEPQSDIDDWVTQTHAVCRKKTLTLVYQAISLDDLVRLESGNHSSAMKKDIALLLKLGHSVFLSIMRKKSCKHDRKIRWICTPCIHPTTQSILNSRFEAGLYSAFDEIEWTKDDRMDYQLSWIFKVATTCDIFELFGYTQGCTKAQLKERFKLLDIIHPDNCSHPAARLAYNKLVRAYNIVKNTDRRNAFTRWCRSNCTSHVIAMDYKGALHPENDVPIEVGKPITVKSLLTYTKSNLQYTEPTA